MVNPYTFAQAQKMTLVKCLLDNDYRSVWKSIGIRALESFHHSSNILWKSHVPENILSKIKSVLVVELLRSWYFFAMLLQRTCMTMDEFRINQCILFIVLLIGVYLMMPMLLWHLLDYAQQNFFWQFYWILEKSIERWC